MHSGQDLFKTHSVKNRNEKTSKLHQAGKDTNVKVLWARKMQEPEEHFWYIYPLNNHHQFLQYIHDLIN